MIYRDKFAAMHDIYPGLLVYQSIEEENGVEKVQKVVRPYFEKVLNFIIKVLSGMCRTPNVKVKEIKRNRIK